MADSWSTQLRVNSAPDNKTKLLTSTGRERFDAAKALLDNIDRTSPQIFANLRKGDAVYKIYDCSNGIRNDRSSPTHFKSEALPNKAELLAAVGLGVLADDSSSVSSAASLPRPVRSYTNSAYRSRHLWSTRAAQIESQLHSLLSDDVPYFSVAELYRVGLKCGVCDSFFALADRRLLRVYCTWTYLSQEFVVNKDVYIPNEIESQIVPLAVSATPATRPVSSIPSTAPIQALLKGITADDEYHLRPLCTAGDLHLALHELADETIFREGVVMLPDTAPGPLVYHNSKVLYRFSYMLGAPSVSWSTLTRRDAMLRKMNLRDYKNYLCPVMCKQAYDVEALPECDVNTAMQAASQLIVDMFSFRKQKKIKTNKVLYELVVDLELCTASPSVQDDALIPDFNDRDAPQLSESEMTALLAEMQTPKLIDAANSEAAARFRILHVVKLQYSNRRQAHCEVPAISKKKPSIVAAAEPLESTPQGPSKTPTTASRRASYANNKSVSSVTRRQSVIENLGTLNDICAEMAEHVVSLNIRSATPPPMNDSDSDNDQEVDAYIAKLLAGIDAIDVPEPRVASEIDLIPKATSDVADTSAASKLEPLQMELDAILEDEVSPSKKVYRLAQLTRKHKSDIGEMIVRLNTSHKKKEIFHVVQEYKAKVAELNLEQRQMQAINALLADEVGEVTENKSDSVVAKPTTKEEVAQLLEQEEADWLMDALTGNSASPLHNDKYNKLMRRKKQLKRGRNKIARSHRRQQNKIRALYSAPNSTTPKQQRGVEEATTTINQTPTTPSSHLMYQGHKTSRVGVLRPRLPLDRIKERNRHSIGTVVSDVGIERLGEQDIHRRRVPIPKHAQRYASAHFWSNAYNQEPHQQHLHKEIREQQKMMQTESQLRIAQLASKESQASLHRILSKMPRSLSNRIQMGLLNKDYVNLTWSSSESSLSSVTDSSDYSYDSSSSSYYSTSDEESSSDDEEDSVEDESDENSDDEYEPEPLEAPDIVLGAADVPPQPPKKSKHRRKKKRRRRKRTKKTTEPSSATAANNATTSELERINEIGELTDKYNQHDTAARPRTRGVSTRHDWRQKRIFRAIFRRIILLLRPPRINLANTAKLPYTSERVPVSRANTAPPKEKLQAPASHPRPPTEKTKRSQQSRQTQRQLSNPPRTAPATHTPQLSTPAPVVSAPRTAGGGKLWGPLDNEDAEPNDYISLLPSNDANTFSEQCDMQHNSYLSFDDSMMLSISSSDFLRSGLEKQCVDTELCNAWKGNDLLVQGVNAAAWQDHVIPMNNISSDKIVDRGIVVHLDSSSVAEEMVGLGMSHEPASPQPAVSRMRVIEPDLPNVDEPPYALRAQRNHRQQRTQSAVAGRRQKVNVTKPTTAHAAQRCSNDDNTSLDAYHFPLESLPPCAATPCRQHTAPPRVRTGKHRSTAVNTTRPSTEEANGDLVIRGNIRRDAETAPSTASKSERVVVSKKPSAIEETTPQTRVSVMTLGCDVQNFPASAAKITRTPIKSRSGRNNLKSTGSSPLPHVLPEEFNSPFNRSCSLSSRQGQGFSEDESASNQIQPPDIHIAGNKKITMSEARAPSPGLSVANSDNWTTIDISPVPLEIPPPPCFERKRRRAPARQALTIANAQWELQAPMKLQQQEQDINLFRSLPQRK